MGAGDRGASVAGGSASAWDCFMGPFRGSVYRPLYAFISYVPCLTISDLPIYSGFPPIGGSLQIEWSLRVTVAGCLSGWVVLMPSIAGPMGISYSVWVPVS